MRQPSRRAKFPAGGSIQPAGGPRLSALILNDGKRSGFRYERPLQLRIQARRSRQRPSFTRSRRDRKWWSGCCPKKHSPMRLPRRPVRLRDGMTRSGRPLMLVADPIAHGGCDRVANDLKRKLDASVLSLARQGFEIARNPIAVHGRSTATNASQGSITTSFLKTSHVPGQERPFVWGALFRRRRAARRIRRNELHIFGKNWLQACPCQ